MLSAIIIPYSDELKKYKVSVAYERPIEWQGRNGTHFAKDMINIMSGKEAKCFLGSMTLLYYHHKYYLIDGDNRTVSGLLLIAILRNKITYLANKHLRSKKGNAYLYHLLIADKIAMNDLLHNGTAKQIPLTIPSSTDKESKRFIGYLRGFLINDRQHSYVKYINSSRKDSVHNIDVLRKAILREVNKVLRNMTYKEQVLFITKAYRRLTSRNVRIVQIMTTDREEAQEIYESINSTGVLLKPQDLIKSYLASTLKKRDQSTMLQGVAKYSRMNSIFNNAKDIPKFLAVYCQAKFGREVTSQSLVKCVDTHMSLVSDAKQFLNETTLLAPVYKELISPKGIKTHRKVPDIDELNSILSLMGEHYYYNVLLAMYYHHRTYSNADICQVFHTLAVISLHRSLTHNSRPHFVKTAYYVWQGHPNVNQISRFAKKENGKIQGRSYTPERLCLRYNETLTKPNSYHFSIISFILANVYRLDGRDFNTEDSIYNSLFKSPRKPDYVLMHLSETVNGGLLDTLGNDVLIEAKLRPNAYKSKRSKLQLLKKSKLFDNNQLYRVIKSKRGLTGFIRKRNCRIAKGFAKLWP